MTAKESSVEFQVHLHVVDAQRPLQTETHFTPSIQTPPFESVSATPSLVCYSLSLSLSLSLSRASFSSL